MFGKSTTTSSVAVCSNINSVLRPKLPASATYNEHKKTYQFNDHLQLNKLILINRLILHFLLCLRLTTQNRLRVCFLDVFRNRKMSFQVVESDLPNVPQTIAKVVIWELHHLNKIKHYISFLQMPAAFFLRWLQQSAASSLWWAVSNSNKSFLVCLVYLWQYCMCCCYAFLWFNFNNNVMNVQFYTVSAR